MIEKTLVWLLTTLLLTIATSSEAQQPGRVPRIGFLSGSGSPSNPAMSERAFRQGLRDLGYIEGKYIVLEVRYADGKRDRIPNLVSDLVHLKVDLIATGNFTAIRAAMAATKSIPIVMVTNADPVATKLIDSLARPGGNVTGLTNLLETSGSGIHRREE